MRNNECDLERRVFTGALESGWRKGSCLNLLKLCGYSSVMLRN